jgi:hypothetical protein
MSLAILHFTGVTPEKFAILQDSATKEMGGGNHTASTGTISDHGATAVYSYDGVNVLTVTVEKISRIFFHKPSLEDVSRGIQAWVEDTLAEALANATAVSDVKPLVDTTKPVQSQSLEVDSGLSNKALSERNAALGSTSEPFTATLTGAPSTGTLTSEPFTGTLTADPITNQPVVETKPAV